MANNKITYHIIGFYMVSITSVQDESGDADICFLSFSATDLFPCHLDKVLLELNALLTWREIQVWRHRLFFVFFRTEHTQTHADTRHTLFSLIPSLLFSLADAAIASSADGFRDPNGNMWLLQLELTLSVTSAKPAAAASCLN